MVVQTWVASTNTWIRKEMTAIMSMMLSETQVPVHVTVTSPAFLNKTMACKRVWFPVHNPCGARECTGARVMILPDDIGLSAFAADREQKPKPVTEET
jgi:hypothetical protein